MKQAERLFQIIGLVDEALVEEALSPPKARRKFFWSSLASAACLALCMAGWLVSGGLSADSAAPASPAGGESSSESFLSYAGPVLPLTVLEDTELTATRHLSFDFQAGGSALVHDSYVLHNPTDRDVTLTPFYPVTGRLWDLEQIQPQTDLREPLIPFTGNYAGGFQSAYGAEKEGSHNLDSPHSWEDYAEEIENGGLDWALSSAPELSQRVTVYEFSSFTAPYDAYKAATQAMEFTIDPERTQILTYGINGASWDEESGWRRYDFFVPEGRNTGPKLLAVMGDDLGSYNLQGYADGSCETAIDGVSCTVTRREMTIDDLLEKLCRAYLEEAEDSGMKNALPFTLFRRCTAELLTEYGPLSETPVDRYQWGRLDDIIAEALMLDRIFYFRLPQITIPAGGDFEINVESQKAASFDFAGSGSDKIGVEGYDFLTALGSSLEFTSQRLSLSDQGEPFDKCLLWSHNLESYFESGGEGALDLHEAHYYISIQRS